MAPNGSERSCPPHGGWRFRQLFAFVCLTAALKTAWTAMELPEQGSRTEVSSVSQGPVFVWLIGPPKTGTTSQQRALSSQSMWDALEKDNYSYMGKCQQKDKCMGHDFTVYFSDHIDILKSEHEPVVAPRFVEMVEENAKLGRNAIVLHEKFVGINAQHVAAMADVMRKNGFKTIKVIATYRRFYEYLVSFYNQRNRPARHRSGWPGERGASDFKPFSLEDPWVRDQCKEVEQEGSTQFTRGLKLYADYVDEIELVHFHQLPSATLPGRDALVENLLCRVVPNAPNACARVKRGIEIDSSNPSFSIDYDMLAVEAYRRGYLDVLGRSNNTELTRQFVTDSIAERVSRLQLGLPITNCFPDATLERLLNASLAVERAVFTMRNEVERIDEEAHRSAFALAVSKKKFCNVDVIRALGDEEKYGWQAFFRSLAAGE